MTQEAAIPPAKAKALDRAMQRSSCLYWATRNLRGPQAPPYNGKFIAGKHHLEWDELVSDPKGHDPDLGPRICIEASRDHGKSQMLNLAYPIWRAAYGKKGELGYIFSANQDLANEFLQKIKEEILNNPKLRWLAPKNHDQTWSAKRIKLTTGVEIRARGFGVRVRGGHPDWIVADDILDDRTITSETVREKAKDFFLSAISNMVIPGGTVIVIGTPFHLNDLYGFLKKQGVYKVRKFPALNEKGEPLWPDRYSKRLLEKKKQEIGSVRFAREFMLQPFSDEISLFPARLFEGEPVRQRGLILNPKGAYWDALGVTSRFMGVDLAISAETGADYFSIYVIGLDGVENRWICYLFRERGMGYQAQLDKINDVSRLIRPDLIFIEANQMQRVWSTELIRTSGLPIKPFFTGGTGDLKSTPTTQYANKHHLEAGIPSMLPILENRKWRIPRGNEESVELTDVWIHEMMAMTFQEGQVQSVSEHDDVALAGYIAEQCARRGAIFSASFGPEDEEPEVPLEDLHPADQAHAAAAARAKLTAERIEADRQLAMAAEAQSEGESDLNIGPVDGYDPGAGQLWQAVPFYRD